MIYTIIITFKLPEFWLHPYGPILKNLPMLAALYMLYVLEAAPSPTLPRYAGEGSKLRI
jgi:hypothetical protein